VIAAIVLAAVTAMRLHSGDFTDGGAMSTQLMATDCGGANHSPSLDWSGVPAGTKSFALILRDPDAPVAGGFIHWVVYDVPASTKQLAGDATQQAGQAGLTTTGKAAYYGPCPPPGKPHHYIFTLYALDVPRLALGAAFSGSEARQAMQGHVLAQATLSGVYSLNPGVRW
jgi:Raf kinase inhibitor-like YbhB/YbcL family protein